MSLVKRKETLTTIIKKSNRKTHSSHHGGAWKVAFADFTLAMMALFMVLWIVNSSPQEEREEVISKLEWASLFEDYAEKSNAITQGQMDKILPGSGNIVNNFGQSAMIDPIKSITPFSRATLARLRKEQIEAQGPAPGQGLDIPPPEEKEQKEPDKHYELEPLARLLLEITKPYQKEMKIQLELIPQGLRIMIQDNNNKAIFERGSSKIAPFFQKLLQELVPTLNKIDNHIIISGHTDSVPYIYNKKYNNWNLSGDRALMARKVLTEAGLNKDRILQVHAMADKMLLDGQKPDSASNRRIEMMVLTRTASEDLYRFFGSHGKKVVAELKYNKSAYDKTRQDKFNDNTTEPAKVSKKPTLATRIIKPSSVKNDRELTNEMTDAIGKDQTDKEKSIKADSIKKAITRSKKEPEQESEETDAGVNIKEEPKGNRLQRLLNY